MNKERTEITITMPNEKPETYKKKQILCHSNLILNMYGGNKTKIKRHPINHSGKPCY